MNTNIDYIVIVICNSNYDKSNNNNDNDNTNIHIYIYSIRLWILDYYNILNDETYVSSNKWHRRANITSNAGGRRPKFDLIPPHPSYCKYIYYLNIIISCE